MPPRPSRKNWKSRSGHCCSSAGGYSPAASRVELSMMLRKVTGGLFAALLWTLPAAAQPDVAPGAGAPWVKAAAAAKDTEVDLQKTGVLGVKAHIDDLENALSEGVKIFPPAPAPDGTVTLLTDGSTETLAATTAAAESGKNAVAVANPYPRIGLYLAVYYDEIGKPEDALRV